jgi:hypothetical protein
MLGVNYGRHRERADENRREQMSSHMYVPLFDTMQQLDCQFDQRKHRRDHHPGCVAMSSKCCNIVPIS